MRGLKRALAVLALLGLAAAPAQAQYFGQNKVQYRRYAWRTLRSDHFTVTFDAGLDSLALRVLDLAEKTDAVLSQRMAHRLGHRVPIVLYASHEDFAQTNIIPDLIEQGTGGFTEMFRNRVVLPFTGSYEDLRHVVVHELSHAYLFDMMYGGSAAQMVARRSFVSVPLWFTEGLAEYLSLGMEPNAEMFMRDGSVEGYLPPLDRAGGYLVYKAGQSALDFLVERHGEERLRELLRAMRRSTSFDRAFQRVMGSPVERFDEQWREWVRRRYWPTVAERREPEAYARRLTDHRLDGSLLNTAPAVSPQGDRIAYFTDRKQYTDVCVMSAIDGRAQGRVIRGERNVMFEAIPSFRSALTWSPDGGRLALTAVSGGRDAILVVSVASGRVLKRLRLGCDALAYPAWSPTGDTLVVVGVKDGRSDLWLVDLAGGGARRLTDDAWDEKEPCWTPDGRTVTFSSDRLAPVVLEPGRRPGGFGAYGLFDLDLASGAIALRLDTGGDDHSPAWSPDGRKLAFVSDRGGASDIYLYDAATRGYVQLTALLGGVSSLSWSREDDRLVFSAFNRGGYDVFAVREPVSVDAVLARLRRRAPGAVLSEQGAQRAGADGPAAPPEHGALARAWPESLTVLPDSARVPGGPGPGATEGGPGPPPAEVSLFPRDDGVQFPAYRDTVPVLPNPTPLLERGGPFALPDSVLAQRPSPYHVRLAPDYAGAGLVAATGFGFYGSTAFVFGDFLGDHRVFMAADVFGGPLSDANAFVQYSYLPRRWDWSVALFHLKDYYWSRVTTTGEQLGSPRLFSERNFGGMVEASLPFDRFRRLDLDFTQMFVERQFFVETPVALYLGGKEYESVSSPAVALVGDNTLWGLTGPVNGARYNVTFAPALAWGSKGRAYRTTVLDARRYWDLTHGYTLAARVLAGRSDGRNAQSFRVGGFSTLRGYRDFDITGTRLAIVNGEVRFPFIQQLGVVGPVPLGSFNLRGAVFGDAGVVWNGGETLRFSRLVQGRRELVSPLFGFGVGLRTALPFAILKLDTAWNTTLAHVSRPRWHFSIGPEF